MILTELDLRDPCRSQSQQVLGTKGSEDLSRDSYRASTLGSNSSTSASREYWMALHTSFNSIHGNLGHELGMGTKPDDQLQTDQLQGGAQALKDSPRYGHGDGKSHDSSGRTEHGGPQRDDSSPTFGASDGALNRTARAGLCGDTSGEESSSGWLIIYTNTFSMFSTAYRSTTFPEESRNVVPNQEYVLFSKFICAAVEIVPPLSGMICCVSDENTSA